MLRNRIRGYVALAVLLLAGAAALAQAAREFSAVIVENSNGKTTRQKIFVGHDRMRVDPDAATAADGAVVILDFSRSAGYVLMPAQKTFIELSGLKPEGTGRMNFLTPADLTHPCDVLRLPGEAAGKNVPCRKDESVMLMGRMATQWTGTLPNGKEGHVWIDTRLGFLLKLETPDTSIELLDIQEGTQPAALFEVPAGYMRLQVGSTTGSEK